MKFTKMHGLGNDFIVTEEHREDYGQLAKELCARHTGIGADGLIAVLPSDVADVAMRIFNSDGSEAQMCGNGIRCLARYAYDHGKAPGLKMRVETLAGIMKPEIRIDGEGLLVAVDMGKPEFEPKKIPVLVEDPLSFTVEHDGKRIELGAVCMGVPHVIVFGEDVSEEYIESMGPYIAGCGLFPEGVNVNFVTRDADDELTVRTYERGAGRTLACGTGSCAAAVIAHARGLVPKTVTIHLELGDLIVELLPDGTVWMTGPAAYVYAGETGCR